MIRLRQELGWSQDSLALECGLDRTFVAHVERLKRNISIDNVERLATSLGVPIRELFAPPTPAAARKRARVLKKSEPSV